MHHKNNSTKISNAGNQQDWNFDKFQYSETFELECRSASLISCAKLQIEFTLIP